MAGLCHGSDILHTAHCCVHRISVMCLYIRLTFTELHCVQRLRKGRACMCVNVRPRWDNILFFFKEGGGPPTLMFGIHIGFNSCCSLQPTILIPPTLHSSSTTLLVFHDCERMYVRIRFTLWSPFWTYPLQGFVEGRQVLVVWQLGRWSVRRLHIDELVACLLQLLLCRCLSIIWKKSIRWRRIDFAQARKLSCHQIEWIGVPGLKIQ